MPRPLIIPARQIEPPRRTRHNSAREVGHGRWYYVAHMQSAPERTLRISFWEWLGSACVLPAAIATGSAASYAIGILGIALRTISPLALEYLWRFGIGHFMSDAATVFVGAVVAPRHQIITALVLTIAQSVLAL